MQIFKIVKVWNEWSSELRNYETMKKTVAYVEGDIETADAVVAAFYKKDNEEEAARPDYLKRHPGDWVKFMSELIPEETAHFPEGTMCWVKHIKIADPDDLYANLDIEVVCNGTEEECREYARTFGQMLSPFEYGDKDDYLEIVREKPPYKKYVFDDYSEEVVVEPGDPDYEIVEWDD